MLDPSTPGGTTAGEVFELIRYGRALTRADLGRVTGLSRTAVAARLAALRSLGLVAEGEVGPSSGGRPPKHLVFNSRAGVVLAVAIGRSRTQVAVCDLEGAPLVTDHFDQEPGAGPDEVMHAAVAALRPLMRHVHAKASTVRGFGCSIPAVVDHVRGASAGSPLMPGWAGVALAPYLHEIAPAPVLLDNDATVLAMSESQALLQSHRDVVMVKASTGLGLGLVADGRLIRGARGAAGEFGHSKTPAAKGRVCRCGDTGCLEAVAGGWALAQRMREDGRSVGHLRDLVALALEGDAQARRLVRDSGRRVGEVLGAAVNLLNPDAVVIGGDMVAAYDVFVAGLRETIYANATALATQDLTFLPASHRQGAGIVGCAALALEHILSPAVIDQQLRTG